MQRFKPESTTALLLGEIGPGGLEFSGVALVFAATSRESFAYVQELARERRSELQRAQVLVVANRKDDESDPRQVSFAQGLALAREVGAVAFAELGTEESENVLSLCGWIARLPFVLLFTLLLTSSRTAARQ